MRALHGFLALVCGLGVAVVAAGAEPAAEWPDKWETTFGADHPLVGRIWSAETGDYVSPGALAKALAAAPLALIGEVHDNVDHHRVQGWAIATVAELRGPDNKSGALVFEHIRADQADTIERFHTLREQARRLYTVHDLFRMLGWEKSGWPEQHVFLPLYGAAVQSRLAIVPGDVPRPAIRAAAKEGPAAIADEERARLQLDAPLDPALDDALLTELEESHCGLMPRSAFGNMAYAQRYRDAHLADAILTAATEHGSAILFAGNGHVRTDRSVPWHVRRRAPDKKLVAVMVLEVEEGKTDPAAYVPRGPDGKLAADYFVFTPRAERTDPCERMKAQFGKRG